jgi:hypothetical protein
VDHRLLEGEGGHLMSILQTDPQDLFCDPNTGDLVISGGDLGLSTGLPGVAQGCRIAVRMVRGEWFLNLDTGIPYFQRDGVTATEAIMGQPFDQAKTLAPFRDALAAVNGVDSVVSVTATYDSPTRTVTVAWAVTATFGGTVADSLALGI